MVRGFFERFVKSVLRSVKELLKKDLWNYKIIFGELETILFKIE